MRWAASALIAALAGAAAVADPVAEALAPPPGAIPTHAAARAFDAARVPVRRAGDGPPTEEVSGRVSETAFRAPADASTAAVTAGYAARLADLGFETVLDCADADCGGFAFRRAITVLPQPAMAVSLGDFRQLTMRREATTVSILASAFGGAVHVQIVVVEGAALSADGAASATATAAAPAQPSSAPQSGAEALAAQIDAAGRAALDGVTFEPGSSRIAPSSSAALDAAAALFALRPELRAIVVGHTDASGDLDLNRRISAERARAVADALAARGVARDRLSAEGVAFLAPRASNASDAGRAANRRVELVAR